MSDTSGWRIDPATVQAVLTNTRRGLSELDSAEKTAQSAVEAASAATGPQTAAALEVLLRNPLLTQIDIVKTTVETVVDQTDTALSVYIEADEEMARAHQTGAGR
ncbi:hypothetical protein BFL36_06020 [Clavibacter michiganensis]|uniref:Uncharacterized protein n=1 Tax=Clavibacter michiganensis TaxID=28447 RepID=A0A251YK57_9MICO|nr:DUF6507 family protein [Clavibacter michiganensis]OUE24625.1 hypothetical protein BFL36_06020 [Clavibacter michiganensis]